MSGDLDRLEKLLAEAERRAAAAERRSLKIEHPYVADLIRVLKSHPEGRLRVRVIEILEAQRHKYGLSIPLKFEQAVQATYNRHAAGSAVFAKRKKPDEQPIFFSPNRGYWAVYEQEAEVWLTENMPPPLEDL